MINNIELIFLIIFISFLVFIVYNIYSWRDFLRCYGRGEKEESKKESMEGSEKKPMTSEGEKRQKIVDNVIMMDVQRTKQEKEREERREQRLKEILRQQRLISGLIMKAWHRDQASPEIMKLKGKNKEERVEIQIYSHYSHRKKEFPSLVTIALKGVPEFRSFDYRKLGELSEKELKAFEDWIVKNYSMKKE